MCWNFLTAVDVGNTFIFGLLMLVWQLQELPLLWSVFETQLREGKLGFTVFSIRVPVLLGTVTFMGRALMGVDQMELAQVCGDTTTLFLLMSLWFTMFTVMKPIRDNSALFRDLVGSRALTAFHVLGWSSFVVVFGVFLVVESLKFVYDRRWFDGFSLVAISLCTLLWLVITLRVWLRYPRDLHQRSSKYVWIVCSLVGLMSPVVFWRIIHLFTRRNEHFVIEDDDLDVTEHIIRTFFAAMQSGFLFVAYDFSRPPQPKPESPVNFVYSPGRGESPGKRRRRQAQLRVKTFLVSGLSRHCQTSRPFSADPVMVPPAVAGMPPLAGEATTDGSCDGTTDGSGDEPLTPPTSDDVGNTPELSSEDVESTPEFSSDDSQTLMMPVATP